LHAIVLVIPFGLPLAAVALMIAAALWF